MVYTAAYGNRSEWSLWLNKAQWHYIDVTNMIYIIVKEKLYKSEDRSNNKKWEKVFNPANKPLKMIGFLCRT